VIPVKGCFCLLLASPPLCDQPLLFVYKLLPFRAGDVLIAQVDQQHRSAAIRCSLSIVPESHLVPEDGELAIILQGKPFDVVPAAAAGTTSKGLP